MKVDLISGTAVPLRGNDIDTDRILPARYLRAVSFEGIEAHLFEDDRQTPGHPFSNQTYRGASILLTNGNFGCGSSREHAPQAIQRWGIRACLGVSFSEIFFGNTVALGLPCLSADNESIEWLMDLVERRPDTNVTIDLERLTARAGDRAVAIKLPPAAQEAFVKGLWDATGMLLERFESVRAVAASLPYVRGF